MPNQVETFSDKIIEDKWRWSSGRCERCGASLTFENRDRDGRGKWVTHSRSRQYIDSATDCMILCWECHKATC